MRIEKVEAIWISCPIPMERRHTSDYGTLSTFDMTLVVITDDEGRVGYGECKAAVASAGSCQALVSCIESEIAPSILGKPASEITRIWHSLYNGTRAHYGAKHGRVFPVLGRRGHLISSLSGIDMALWDLKGKTLNTSLVSLLGGRYRTSMPAYASGGWADLEGIGNQVAGYVSKGFQGVKMRVGIVDGDVYTSALRTEAARASLPSEVKLMVDAHGTWSFSEAKKYLKLCDHLDLHWIEEPLSPDMRSYLPDLKRISKSPIAAGESEFTRFDIRDLIQSGGVDVLQPDLAIIGGISEARYVSQLAEIYQLEFAPHCWGSPLSFSAGVQLAFASSTARYIEYSLGYNPLMRHLSIEDWTAHQGMVALPTSPGLGVTINWDFVNEYRKD